jgi:hypothetical protein
VKKSAVRIKEKQEWFVFHLVSGSLTQQILDATKTIDVQCAFKNNTVNMYQL